MRLRILHEYRQPASINNINASTDPHTFAIFFFFSISASIISSPQFNLISLIIHALSEVSWRQGNIDLNEWYLFDEGPKHAYISSLPNDFDHTREPTHVPESTARAELSTSASSDQVPDLDRSNTSSAPGTFLYEHTTPDDPRNITWPLRLHNFRNANGSPGHTAFLRSVKYRSINKVKHGQGSNDNPRRRHQKQVK